MQLITLGGQAEKEGISPLFFLGPKKSPMTKAEGSGRPARSPHVHVLPPRPLPFSSIPDLKSEGRAPIRGYECKTDLWFAIHKGS